MSVDQKKKVPCWDFDPTSGVLQEQRPKVQRHCSPMGWFRVRVGLGLGRGLVSNPNSGPMADKHCWLLLCVPPQGCRSPTPASTRSACRRTGPGRSSNTSWPSPSPTLRALAWSNVGPGPPGPGPGPSLTALTLMLTCCCSVAAGQGGRFPANGFPEDDRETVTQREVRKYFPLGLVDVVLSSCR